MLREEERRIPVTGELYHMDDFRYFNWYPKSVCDLCVIELWCDVCFVLGPCALYFIL